MSVLGAKLETMFEDIFQGQPDNTERRERYAAKSGPYILEYAARGDTFFTSGKTPNDARRRTNEKEPQGWVFIDIKTEQAWFAEVGK